MEAIDNSSHEKDSGIGRTDESTKNEDSSDGLECLENHSFGDYHHHQQQHHQRHQMQRPESQPISCSRQCRHKNLSPVKDSKSDRTFFNRTGIDPYSHRDCIGDSSFLRNLRPSSPTREKNWRDKLERLEKMRCHYECRLLQLELMKVNHIGHTKTENRLLDVNRNLVNLRLSADENSNVKIRSLNLQSSNFMSPTNHKSKYHSNNSFANFKQRSRSNEVDYCMRNLSARGGFYKKPKIISSRTHQYYVDPINPLLCNNRINGINNSPSRRPVPKMGIRRLEECLQIQHLMSRPSESSPNNIRMQTYHQEVSQTSKSFFTPDPIRLLHHQPNPSRSHLPSCKNENVISSPARYKVENGRIYRLPLITRDVPKSEQLSNSFQTFMPLQSNHAIQNRFCHDRDILHNFNPSYDSTQHNFTTDTNNNNERNNICKDTQKSIPDNLRRRPWFGSLTQVDGKQNHMPTKPASGNFFGRNQFEATNSFLYQQAKVWEYLKDDAKISTAEDDFDNYVEWLTMNRPKCFYENLKSTPQRMSDQKFHNEHLTDPPVHFSACFYPNQTNSDFEGCQKMTSIINTRDFYLPKDSEDSENDYVDIDDLNLTTNLSSSANIQPMIKKKDGKHSGKKSAKKKQLLRDRARKLAEERNSKNKNDSLFNGNISKSKNYSCRKSTEKRKTRQNRSTADSRSTEGGNLSDDFQPDATSDNENGFIDDIQYENIYSSLVEYESLSDVVPVVKDIAEEQNAVLYVRPKISPFITSV